MLENAVKQEGRREIVLQMINETEQKINKLKSLKSLLVLIK